MASLKDLRNRISSVKSTQKITSAMKMVAAAKLRRAQEQAEASRPYAERMDRMLGSLAASVAGKAGAPALLAGSGKDDVHLIIVGTADRGLCGGFNSSIARESRNQINALKAAGKTVKVLCVGRKGRDQLRREFSDLIIDTIEDIAKPALKFDSAHEISERVIAMFEAGEIDVCTIVYAEFKSVISQIVTTQQLIPFVASAKDEGEAKADTNNDKLVYDYEPEEEKILADLLPRNLAVQIFKALLENNASEQGARMSAMDNATRNAGEMIGNLNRIYNRTRQAVITNELIEIISAKEAM
ncbi:F0F1 ATP synthase subunit gamma [Denitrobaculum tricleocarpae]|uniref:ATP synthase gamma chain n=1 Tax=Denitrobaculum tricleocarpae TaxID=2591009 RepID=A0A545TQR6_9PROT|nr:F0F1 ATP synthase subunit gamma [Denitrobaculum tricleocarpae]TQV79564.1 F0F1 ATP synthase subunit gamma [Denitrobaculum tricleocarpae]